MQQQIPITIVVPVLDEAENLARCLTRLGRFSEVVVIDNFFDMEEITAKLKAHVEG